MASKTLLQNIVTGLLVACAMAVAVSLVHREFFASNRENVLAKRYISNWKDLGAGRALTFGGIGAPVTILAFSDYECPFCKNVDGKLHALDSTRPGLIKVIRYELPLTAIHRHAYEAALAGKCAARQGVTGAFQVEVYRNSASLDSAIWREVATAAEVPDLEVFMKCVEQKSASAEVDADVALAERLGFTGTPVLIVNGEVLVGDLDDSQLLELVNRYAKG